MGNIVKSGNEISVVGAIVVDETNAVAPIDERKLVVESYELNKQKAQIEEALKSHKAEFFKLADARVGKGNAFTIYSPEDGLKLARQVSMRGGGSVSSADMLGALCEYFGEDMTDKNGKAWKLFKEISDEPVVQRVVNTDRLADLIKKMEEVESGMRKASSMTVPTAVLKSVISKPSISESFNPKRMTKAELESIE